jgi:5-methylcytosine-specific restriction endonuclease McrA
MKKPHDTLVLNKGWCPIHVISWKKGMSLLYKDDAHALDRDYLGYAFKDWLEFSRQNPSEYAEVHTVSLTIAIPEIIVLKKYDKLPDREVKFSRENVFNRDKMKCQYCGKIFTLKELTIDHVLPKSQGGKNTWNNIVACCKPCNAHKANRRPEEIGMKLIHKPVKPRWINPITHNKGKTITCTSWKKFMDRVDTDEGVKHTNEIL